MPPVVMKEAAKPLENDPAPRRPDRALPVPASMRPDRAFFHACIETDQIGRRPRGTMNGQGSRSSEPERVRVGFRLPKTALAAVMLLAACTAAHQPRYADIAATVPPMSADRARLYFYRDYEPYESLARPYIYLNGQPSDAA